MSKIRKEFLWGLSYHLAKYILPRLQAFRKLNKAGIPTGLKDIEEWNGLLDKMIFAFKFIKEDEEKVFSYKKSDFIKVKRGLNLFAKYFTNLWD